MATCTHVGSIRPDVVADPPPGPDGRHACGDCLAEGTRWLHLRMCTSCGHVGCCDSSPRRHATGHHQATAHPIIRSAEPGEGWLWCYVDQAVVDPA